MGKEGFRNNAGGGAKAGLPPEQTGVVRDAENKPVRYFRIAALVLVALILAFGVLRMLTVEASVENATDVPEELLVPDPGSPEYVPEPPTSELAAPEASTEQ